MPHICYWGTCSVCPSRNYSYPSGRPSNRRSAVRHSVRFEQESRGLDLQHSADGCVATTLANKLTPTLMHASAERLLPFCSILLWPAKSKQNRHRHRNQGGSHHFALAGGKTKKRTQDEHREELLAQKAFLRLSWRVQHPRLL